ncbi:hypothetical protein ACLVWU_08500 [Bdellovibrio sp. HCB290]|uniref:hypothetical protein n=1 Tax=Bdellovibrio sp. HCB290 TaxID=3394356 RepID=UPI0039B42D63
MAAPTINYETKKLVAFLDVMGFKELLKTGHLSKLQKYYDIANEYLDGKAGLYRDTASNDNFQRIFVSDSIIMSIDLIGDKSSHDIDRVRRFFSAVSLLQYLLATKAQVWTRGAISVGNLFMDQATQTLVGPAYIQAYELESKADYPRVIIDPRVFAFFEMSAKGFKQRIHDPNNNGTHIIVPELGGSVALPKMQNEAVFLDWFRQSFDRTENLDFFFEDLSERIFLKQDIFEKGNKLIRYLVECYIERTSIALDRQFRSRAETIKLKIDAASGLNLPAMNYRGQ